MQCKRYARRPAETDDLADGYKDGRRRTHGSAKSSEPLPPFGWRLKASPGICIRSGEMKFYRIAAEALGKRLPARAGAEHRSGNLDMRKSNSAFASGMMERASIQKVLSAGGRDGHFGLRSMKERAEVTDGKLENLGADGGAGTEIELTIPAPSAYIGVNAGLWFAPKFLSTATEVE